MKIFGGRLKGRSIKVNKHIDFRPALGVVREAVFDILQFKIEPQDLFLDLFGGTGGIGIEAYSRGIDTVYINELDGENFNFIKGNVENFKIEENIQVFNKDFRNMLDYILNNNIVFDYIYIAPPYKEREFYAVILDFFKKHPQLLHPHSLLFVEYHRRTRLDFSGYTVYKDKKYGATKLTILKKEIENA